jgi:hypothetical protein
MTEQQRATEFEAWRIDAARTRIQTCEQFGLPVDPRDRAIVEAADQ